MPATLHIPPLQSGGIMLTYRCSNACRHCLYRCSPDHDAVFMSEDMIDAVFASLAAEKQLHGVHLAGGEATLNWERLAYALCSAQAHGVAIDYLETNAVWCTDEREARERFAFLRAAGLRAVLISASLFHLEFIPLAHTCAAIAAAQAVFDGNVIIWTSDVLQLMLENLEEDRTYTLSESCEILGFAADGADVWRLHSYLTSGGRAVEALGQGLPHYPSASFEGDACAAVLQRTEHFHIAPDGSLWTGLCPGIAPADIQNLHPDISPEATPVFHTLARQGPCGLLPLAGPGFTPLAKGYVSKCHLCQNVRRLLHETGAYAELRPAGFYR